MSKNYDNWERLVCAVLRREHDKEIALRPSLDLSSIASSSSSFRLSFSSNSDFDELLTTRTFNFPRKKSDLALEPCVWKAMLPPNKTVWKSLSLSFFLDKETGNNCLLQGVANLKISSEEGSLKKYRHAKSRFTEVVEVLFTKMTRIQGTIQIEMLTPKTYYAAFLVYGSTEDVPVYHTAIASIKFLHDEADIWSGIKKEDKRRFQFLTSVLVIDRPDGWMEVELGHIFVGLGGSIEIQVELLAHNTNQKSGLVVEGIEVRPWGSLPPSEQTRAEEFGTKTFKFDQMTLFE